ncbi:hypothetical protein H0H92_013145, partial [Tricholoma furcatifolium]
LDREQNGNHPQRRNLAVFKPPVPKGNTKPSNARSALSLPASDNQADEDLQTDLGNEIIQRKHFPHQDLTENLSVPSLQARATIPATRVMTQQLESDDGSEGDEYIPPPAPEEEDSGEDEAESDEKAEEEPAKRGKRCKATRDDVSALRATDIASGKRAASHFSEPPSKKTKTSKKTPTLRKGWESRSAREAAQTGCQQPGSKSSEQAQADSMVSYGGFISDNDEGRMEEDGVKALGPRGFPSLIKITGHKTFTPRTQKELRGGRAKWLLTDLPDNAGNTFSNELMPLVRRKA